MSNPDPPPQSPLPPFIRPPCAGWDVAGVWPPPPPPPFMKPRNLENNSATSGHLPPIKSQEELNKSSGNKSGTSHIFYKTRICTKFMEGNCRNGERCSFAHGAQDLREPPPNWQELVKEKGIGNTGDDRMVHRMKICKRFYNGEECPYGEKCNFLHERPAKSKADISGEGRESAAISIGTVGPGFVKKTDNDQPDNSGSDTLQAKFAFWKTKICGKWEIGQCPFGERCHYAHGKSELQLPGARIEAELIMSSLSQSQINPVSMPAIASSPAPAPAVIEAPATEDAEAEKRKKWKIGKQINRIYADWIDDLSPPYLSPSREEI